MNIKDKPKFLFFKRIVNTFFSPKIHGRFNKGNAFKGNIGKKKLNKIELFFHKITHRLWFFPSMYSAKFWVDFKLKKLIIW